MDNQRESSFLAHSKKWKPPEPITFQLNKHNKEKAMLYPWTQNIELKAAQSHH